jgi:ATP-dependent exoDNAse (exonuclease V) alpha subunit
MELNSQAQKAFDLIEFSTKSLLVTGKAGTGKSSFIKYLTSKSKKKIVVAAPTGIAAINARGMTIHSLFQLPFGPIKLDDERLYHTKYTSNKRKLLREIQVLILDEVSMVRADILDAIDVILRQHSENQDLPFGGKQIILVGDPFQLEPVVTPQDRQSIGATYRSFYFFYAKAYQKLSPAHIQFEEVYRQSDKFFINLLDKVRIGIIEEEELEDINYQFEAKLPKDKFVILLASRRDTVENTNTNRLNELSSIPSFYNGTIEKNFPPSQLPTAVTLSFKVGAQVMFIKNDTDKRWVNGTLAKVIELNPESVKVKLDNGIEYEVKTDVWENIEYSLDKDGKIKEEIKGKFTQVPLQLAWAVTIHKSQGLTFEHVEINLNKGAFAAGQLYVALSRCKTLDGISLQTQVQLSDVKIHPEVVAFMNGDLYFDD